MHHKLAVYTFNQFVAPYESDQIKGFREAEPIAFDVMDRAEGFIGRSGYADEEGVESWGEQVFPVCWENANGDGWAPSTLSLWSSIEAIMAATYHGFHGAALRQGKKWHISADHIPEYVLWWTAENHKPNWKEAVIRFESLMANGPNPQAFTFKRTFDYDGNGIKPDMAVVKDLATKNAKRD